MSPARSTETEIVFSGRVPELAAGAVSDSPTAGSSATGTGSRSSRIGRRGNAGAWGSAEPSRKSRHTSVTIARSTGVRPSAMPLISALSQMTLMLRGMPAEHS
jgi:hypothetical protein